MQAFKSNELKASKVFIESAKIDFLYLWLGIFAME